MTEPVRLSKRVSDMKGCSRREAELYIEGGWVRVDGKVVEVPASKVSIETVELDAKARLEPVAAVTLLLHKPPGLTWDHSPTPARQLLVPQNHWSGDSHHAPRLLQRHLNVQNSITPLETDASGLMVFSQDWRVERKLVQDAALVEHELTVDVRGDVSAKQLDQLNRTPVIDGRAMLPARVSINRQADGITGLRFAVKGHRPGQIAQMCTSARLQVVAMKRLRVGRIAMAALPIGQWRYLAPFEKF